MRLEQNMLTNRYKYLEIGISFLEGCCTAIQLCIRGISRKDSKCIIVNGRKCTRNEPRGVVEYASQHAR